MSLQPGPMDQALVEKRSDVIVFTTDPLPEIIEVTGRVRVKLWVSSDAPDTDFIVRLCIVGADGNSYNMMEGAIRARFRVSLGEEHLLEPGKIYPLEVDLWSTSLVFNRGNRIRIQIASTSSPGYEVNPNSGLPLGDWEGSRVAHNHLHVGPTFPAAVILPIVPFERPEATH